MIDITKVYREKSTGELVRIISINSTKQELILESITSILFQRTGQCSFEMFLREFEIWNGGLTRD